MTPLITGSLAFDNLLHTGGHFADRLPALSPLPPDNKSDNNGGSFSAAYLVPTLARALGGCAGNIAYALHQLGDTPTLMATAGNDFAPYAERLAALGIGTAHILILEDFYTAQAYIVTDEGNSQLIFFHPGATGEAHRQRIADIPPPPLAIVAPNGKAGMLQHSRDLAAAGIPFIFDPGQAIGMFSGEEIVECLTLAPYAIFNESEFSAAQSASGLTAAAAAAMTEALFVTSGERGSRVYLGGDGDGGEVVTADCVTLGATQDPTGCGDAYRAGLLYGLMRGWQWLPLLRFAAVIAAVKATHLGGQGYALSLASAAAAYQKTFGAPPP